MAKEEIKKETSKVAKPKKDTIKEKNSLAKKASTSKAKVADAKKSPAKSDTKTKTAKKVSASKTVTKKSSAKTKTSSKTPTKRTPKKGATKSMLSEYYDLPYRYNETIVKILAQTPTTLFVYWDISDEDRNTLIQKHGENFFYDTKPILIVHNLTNNYSFEIEINDFANSWYIRTQEPNCDYTIELGRRFYNNNNEYIYINSSNNIISPNDHILFEKADLGNVLFKNIKTNTISSKDFGDLKFINNIDKLYGNIYDVYSAIYDDELLNELSNPSSGEFVLKK